MKKKRLLIIRHFPTENNLEGKIMGDCINQEIVNLANSDLQKGSFDFALRYKCVYASPTQRAQMTAKIIFDCPILLDDRIRPRGIGNWAGKTLKDIKAICGKAVYEKEGKLYYNLLVSPPNSENIMDFLIRIRGFLADILEREEDDIAVVTHSMVGATIRAIAAGDSLYAATEKYTLDFYSRYLVSINKKVIDSLDSLICEVE